MGVERTPNKSQQRKLTLEMNSFQRSLQGFEPFDHESGALPTADPIEVFGRERAYAERHTATTRMLLPQNGH